ncbi:MULTISPECIES: hypothetical protein [unclassified Nitrospina]|uniref:hypothetical protein n=1 Tax=unclassified Nitrospina TaxID=2638683 RepID=UPI003F9C3514
MDTEDSYLDEVYERFNQAIMNAIVNSEEIRGILKEIGGKGYINESSVFNLFLSLEELDEYIHSSPPGSAAGRFPGSMEGVGEKPAPNHGEATTPPAQPQVDGRRLTDTELRYLEYAMHRFDEKSWLKKIRLKM